MRAESAQLANDRCRGRAAEQVLAFVDSDARRPGGFARRVRPRNDELGATSGYAGSFPSTAAWRAAAQYKHFTSALGERETKLRWVARLQRRSTSIGWVSAGRHGLGRLHLNSRCWETKLPIHFVSLPGCFICDCTMKELSIHRATGVPRLRLTLASVLIGSLLSGVFWWLTLVIARAILLRHTSSLACCCDLRAWRRQGTSVSRRLPFHGDVRSQVRGCRRMLCRPASAIYRTMLCGRRLRGSRARRYEVKSATVVIISARDSKL